MNRRTMNFQVTMISLSMQSGVIPIEQPINVSMAAMRRNRILRKPSVCFWKRQKREMHLPCLSWDVCMQMAWEGKQIPRKRMNGMGKR